MSKVTSIPFGRRVIVPTATGLKMTTRGQVLQPGHFFTLLGKSEARKVRKELRKVGFARHAAAPANLRTLQPCLPDYIRK